MSRGQPRFVPRLPLPKKTAEWIERHGRLEDNLGLYLDRFVYRDEADRWSLKGPQRCQELERFAGPHTSEAARESLQRRLEGVTKLTQTELEALLRRLEGAKKLSRAEFERGRGMATLPSAPLLVRLEGKLLGKLLVDYGRKGTNEAGLSFHPLYGAPRIPGSALKGAARAQAVLEGWDEEKVTRVFGNHEDEAQSGRVCFLDALPVKGQFNLVLDTLTPHHKRWNNGELLLPLETESPEPFGFLAAARATFVFDVMVLPLGAPTKRRTDADLLKITLGSLKDGCEVLIRALSDFGVGGKTAAGYGWFEFAE